jgi:hypothetical protein
MLQQPTGGAMGSAYEVNITTSELNRTMKVMYRCGVAAGRGKEGAAGGGS